MTRSAEAPTAKHGHLRYTPDNMAMVLQGLISSAKVSEEAL